MGLFGRGPEVNMENREREPIARYSMFCARHPKKENLPDGRQPVTAQGLKEAIEKGAQLNYFDLIKNKIAKGKKVKIFASPLERTTVGGIARATGVQSKDLTNHEGVDSLDFAKWMQGYDMETGKARPEKSNFDVEESKLLLFLPGDGKYKDVSNERFKEGKYLDWLIHESDKQGKEEAQDPTKATTFSIEAGNVAEFFYNNGVKGLSDASKEENNSDFALATSHQGVFESFLYKVISKQENIAEADKLVDSLKATGGFSENSGYDVEFRKYSEKEDDWDMLISYEGKRYVVKPEEMKAIMGERAIQISNMDDARKVAEKK